MKKLSKSVSPKEKKSEEDIYAFNEVDENEVGGRKKKRKVLKVKKIRSKKGNTEANLISKAERKVLLNAHIKHKKTLTNSEKLELEDDDRKAKENKKAKPKVRKNQDVPVVKRALRKVLSDKNENVPEEPKTRNCSTPSRHVNPFIQIFDKITPNKSTLHNFSLSPASLQGCSPIPGGSPRPTCISSTPKYTPCVMEPSPDRELPDKSHSTPIHNSLDASTVHHFSAITPVKYHEDETCTTVLIDPKQFNTSNCFGFDEPEISLKETLDLSIRNPECEFIVHKNACNDRETVPTKEVIKRLRFELNEPDTIVEPSSKEETEELMTTSRIPEDTSILLTEEVQHPKSVFDPKQQADESNMIKLPRRSYERHMRPKRKKIIICGKIEHDDEELSDEDEEEEKKPKSYKKKGGKKQGKPNEKQDPAMEKWIKEFNSQCQQVDKFDLCVE